MLQVEGRLCRCIFRRVAVCEFIPNWYRKIKPAINFVEHPPAYRVPVEVFLRHYQDIF